MRVILDTNVFISGLIFPESTPGKILKAWRSASLDLMISEPLLVELRRVLSYPKIHQRLHWDEQQVDRYLLLLRFFAEVVDVAEVSASVPRDHADEPVLATLLASNADYLVTGDDDLLSLRESYAIISPAEFWRRCA